MTRPAFMVYASYVTLDYQQAERQVKATQSRASRAVQTLAERHMQKVVYLYSLYHRRCQSGC